jgi:hypothetical protein
MIVQTEKEDFNDLADRIIEGVNKALRQLVETSAANDKSLVVGDEMAALKLCLQKSF